MGKNAFLKKIITMFTETVGLSKKPLSIGDIAP